MRTDLIPQILKYDTIKIAAMNTSVSVRRSRVERWRREIEECASLPPTVPIVMTSFFDPSYLTRDKSRKISEEKIG